MRKVRSLTSVLSRRKGQPMLSAMRWHRAGVVICYHLDRFARDVAALLDTLRVWARAWRQATRRRPGSDRGGHGHGPPHDWNRGAPGRALLPRDRGEDPRLLQRRNRR